MSPFAHRVAWLGALVACAPTLARADGATYTEQHRALMITAQVLQKEGKLVRAREVLASCVNEACGADTSSTECEAMRTFCAQHLAEVTRAVPTVQFSVRDDRGLPVRPTVFVLDGVAVDPSKTAELDPGHHTARALYAGRAAESRFVVTQGQKDVPVALHVDLRTTVLRRPVPAGVWVLGALALAAGGLSGATGGYTVQGYAALDACKPLCEADKVGALQTTGYVADVSGIVAVASALAATVWFLARPSLRETRWLRATTGAE